MKKVITHSGPFHADDVFAVATLQLVFGVENLELTRTREGEIIETGDIVVDVGGVYDETRQRFDHHQKGAPVRDNGIPYAAFGLVWKQYGQQLCDSLIAAEIEESLVLPIDASDNGISLYHLTNHNIKPAMVSSIIGLFNPVRGSGEDAEEAFAAALLVARNIIKRAIAHAKVRQAMGEIAKEAYEKTPDKKILEFDVPMSKSLLVNYPEVLFIICPDDPASNDNWLAVAIPVSGDGFELRKSFPSEWGGLREAELAAVSGIADAVFCHRAGFLFVSKTKEGAWTAAQKAIGNG